MYYAMPSTFLAILAMAGSLDLHVVAEGVETKEQLMMLQSLNCLEYLGYYFSKPVPAKYFLGLLSFLILL